MFTRITLYTGTERSINDQFQMYPTTSTRESEVERDKDRRTDRQKDRQTDRDINHCLLPVIQIDDKHNDIGDAENRGLRLIKYTLSSR